MNVTAITARSFDVFVTTCGYEKRASYIARDLGRAAYTVVLDYECAGLHSYDVNKCFYQTIENVKFVPLGRDDLRHELAGIFASIFDSADRDQPSSVLIDVSSCSRRVMAAAFLALSDAAVEPCQLSVAYALSVFDRAPEGELPSSISEPVIGDLSGWSEDLSKPPCAVIGLGFEPGRALGSLDYLEVPEVRLFLPHGPDERFDLAVRAANQLLISEAGEDLVFPYHVTQPNATFDKLHSLILGLTSQFRPVVMPLGPKIFAAISIVLAIKLFPLVCVWRTSSGDSDASIDINPSGEVSVFETVFGGDPPQGRTRPATPFGFR